MISYLQKQVQSSCTKILIQNTKQDALAAKKEKMAIPQKAGNNIKFLNKFMKYNTRNRTWTCMI